tara:strand:- start:134 stop:550 length:417 start_codon:yes stop_codon:yes gene_type:complete
MGNTTSIRKINFEDMQNFIKDDNVIIINTLDASNQQCLIDNTTPASQEIALINQLLQTNIERKIIIYGMNASDESLGNKYNQLTKLGFSNTYVYVGGLFEWLLLQDIYGFESFPTTKKELDILKYKGDRLSKRLMLTY